MAAVPVRPLGMMHDTPKAAPWPCLANTMTPGVRVAASDVTLPPVRHVRAQPPPRSPDGSTGSSWGT